MASPSPSGKSRAKRRRRLHWSGAVLFAVALLSGLITEGAPPHVVIGGATAVLAAIALVFRWKPWSRPGHRSALVLLALIVATGLTGVVAVATDGAVHGPHILFAIASVGVLIWHAWSMLRRRRQKPKSRRLTAPEVIALNATFFGNAHPS